MVDGRRGGRVATAAAALGATLLAGCVTTGPYTVDDGRKVDEQLVAQIRVYGQGERALRPAVVRAAALRDADCEKQWDLPITVVSSDAWSADERVAWKRALDIDERLTVLAAAPGAPLRQGDRIVAVEAADAATNAEQLSLAIARHRDAGTAFGVRTADGRSVRIEPFQLCRGYARFAPPNTPKMQDYHWLMTMHPLEVGGVGLSDEEALWVVLWSQGLSEEAGAKMKTYQYTTSVMSTLYQLVSLASGLKGAAVAAEAAANVARSAASKVAQDFVKQQIDAQTRAVVADQARGDLGGEARKLSRQEVLSAMQRLAAHRNSLQGVARIAAGLFDRADHWAFERMRRLGANPRAAFTLHQKLIERGAAENAVAFDIERLTALMRDAESAGFGDDVVAILKGERPDALELALGAMPLASAPTSFSYEEPAAAKTPYARGLIDATLEMPVESKGRK